MANLALVCDKGAVRRVNQDACCVMAAASMAGEVVMAVVCDGVGGLSAGEVASSTVVRGFVRWFECELPGLIRDFMRRGTAATVEGAWKRLLCDLNDTMLQNGAKAESLMGTTFTGMLVCGGSYLVGHVGDCRAYIVRGATIEQITEDQTLMARMIANGELKHDALKGFERNNVILQSVGTQKKLVPAFYTGNVGQHDICVLCSDGAYKMAGEPGLLDAFAHADVCSERGLREACDDVLTRDLVAGERDNLTMVCFSDVREGCDGTEGEGR